MAPVPNEHAVAVGSYAGGWPFLYFLIMNPTENVCVVLCLNFIFGTKSSCSKYGRLKDLIVCFFQLDLDSLQNSTLTVCKM
jgi:hypothetical protein